METKKLIVYHYDPAVQSNSRREYTVPNPQGATVLQALQYIYAELDHTLAFRYGCRYRRCGLCGMMIDGKPRLACRMKLGCTSEVAPLSGLPLLRSLVVDRTSYMKTLDNLALYPQNDSFDPLGKLQEDPLHKNLINCVECLCCVSSCAESQEKDCASPFALIKLAQLHLDPRDKADRRKQANSLGIDKCAECGKCSCPNGIRLQEAIEALK